VLFALGDVRRASILMIAGAAVGVATMVLASTLAASSDRAAALAVGYGAAQTVAALLLTIRVHRLTGAMAWRAAVRVTAESVVAATVAAVAMLWVVGRFEPTRRQAAPALLLAGITGVAVFAAVLASLGWRELRGWRRSRLR
jgi:peptidoglycan biosynthesis protein MviN/MurJ (putative lipid II flippase)